jgi:hypothetical protein
MNHGGRYTHAAVEGMQARIVELEEYCKVLRGQGVELRRQMGELEAENARLRELVEVAEEAVELERSIFRVPDDGTTVVLRDGWTGKPIVGKVFDFSCFATRAEDAKYATYIDGWTGAEMEPVR